MLNMSMDDDREIIDQFITEAREHLDTLEDDFMALERQKDNPSRKLVDKVFRSIHSIKGAAGFIGLSKIGELAHVMETLLSMMRAGEIRPESEFVDALLSGLDLLNAMVDDIDHCNDTDISKVHDRLASMLAKTLSPKVKGQLNTPVRLSSSHGDIDFDINEFTLKNIPVEMSLYVLKYDLNELAGTDQRSPVTLIRDLLSTGEIIDAKIHITSDDLHDGLPQAPLMYEVLYATILFPDDIQEMTGLAEDRIVHVRKDGDDKNIPISSEFRVPNADFKLRGQILRDPSLNADKTKSVPAHFPEIPVPEIPIPETPTPEAPTPEIPALETPMQKTPKTEVPEPKQQRETQPETARVRKSPKPEAVPTDEDEASYAADTGDTGQTIRIHVDILDKLMMLAGELVLVRNQQLLSTENANAVSRSISQRLDIVTSELQETIMQARMQPIGKIFRKFPRIVRELGKNHGKNIRITVSGSKVELDKTILESLADPLIHLIRNCCDHGIETPEQRKAAGKSETGHIILNAWHEAGHINIDIRDDGRGIEPNLIRRKALEKGIKTPSELNRMKNRDILNLILLPGFSTAEKVSDLSGRGVGMDVVKISIERLGGSLDIESVPGQGAVIHLRLPLTLAIIPCLIITLGDCRYAIPQVNLVELVCLYDDDIRTKIECAKDQEIHRLRDRLLPMVRLSEILANSRPFTMNVRAKIAEDHRTGNSEDESLNFAVLKVGESRFGLIIDRVLGTEEIVVKPMHQALKSVRIYSGATVMGDGKVALILDAEEIAKHAGIPLDEYLLNDNPTQADVRENEDFQTILLFKYGEKERFAITLPLIRRIERISISEIETVGEKEFITINGISTRVLRPNHVLGVSPGMEREGMFLIIPKYIRRPIGLLASALIDIEETAVELNVETYMEDGLLGTAVIRNHMTLFIDIYRVIEKAEPEWFAERRMSIFGAPGPPPKAEKKILLVEDASFFRQLVRRYLEADGHRVTTAEDGRIGLECLNENRFDLVVSDLEMPVMDGWTFMKNVRENSSYPNIPSVALTALESDEDRERAKASGFDQYEVKIDREHFLTTVAELLGVQK